MIFLFTDGKPEINIFSTSAKLQREILDFYSKDNKPPIYVVALGNHDEKNLRFLKNLTQLVPNGGFIAR